MELEPGLGLGWGGAGVGVVGGGGGAGAPTITPITASRLPLIAPHPSSSLNTSSSSNGDGVGGRDSGAGGLSGGGAGGAIDLGRTLTNRTGAGGARPRRGAGPRMVGAGAGMGSRGGAGAQRAGGATSATGSIAFGLGEFKSLHAVVDAFTTRRTSDGQNTLLEAFQTLCVQGRKNSFKGDSSHRSARLAGEFCWYILVDQLENGVQREDALRVAEAERRRFGVTVSQYLRCEKMPGGDVLPAFKVAAKRKEGSRQGRQ